MEMFRIGDEIQIGSGDNIDKGFISSVDTENNSIGVSGLSHGNNSQGETLTLASPPENTMRMRIHLTVDYSREIFEAPEADPGPDISFTTAGDPVVMPGGDVIIIPEEPMNQIRSARQGLQNCQTWNVNQALNINHNLR